MILLANVFCVPSMVMGQDHTHIPDRGGAARIPWYTSGILTEPYYSQEQYADTSLTGFQHYDFRHRAGRLFADKGNVGHQTRSLFFQPVLHTGFRMLPDNFYAGYIVSPADIRFYRPEHVFSELFYITGSANEQLLSVMHNQRMHEHFYAGLLFQVVNSPGFHSRLEARNANLTLTADAEPLSGYRIMGAFYVNRVINDESGGLSNHIAFEDDPVRDSVFLYTAESRYRETAFQFHQVYQPRIVFENDTLNVRESKGLGSFYHAFSYRRKAFVFDEPIAPSGYFYDPGDDPALDATFDSTLVHILENTLGFTSFAADHATWGLPVQLRLSLTHTRINIRNTDLQSIDPDAYGFLKDNYQQLKPSVVLGSDPEHPVSFRAFAEGIIGGYNANDKAIGGSVTGGRLSANLRLSLSFVYAEQEAPYLQNKTRSNYISWDNDFNKVKTSHLQLKMESGIANIQANYYQLSDAVVLDENAMPVQLDDVVRVFSLRLESTLNIGRFYASNDIVFQHTNESGFETFPGLLSQHSVFAKFVLFDGALNGNAGFDIRYNSPYQQMAYMPMVRQFYVQNSYESDHDILLDVFLNARISRARLFVKLEHILGLLPDARPIYGIPFYPLPEAMFKFGISWMFFD